MYHVPIAPHTWARLAYVSVLNSRSSKQISDFGWAHSYVLGLASCQLIQDGISFKAGKSGFARLNMF